MSRTATIASLREQSWSVDAVVSAVAGDPGMLPELVAAVAADRPAGMTFLYASLSFARDEDLGPLVERAMELLRSDPERDSRVPESILNAVALQRPIAVRPFLRELWHHDPMDDSYCESWAWQCADDLEVARLKALVNRHRHDMLRRRRALGALLETRDEAVLRWALASPASEDADMLLAEVGYAWDGHTLTRLTPAAWFHLLPPPDYVPGHQLAAADGEPIHHPTWQPQDGAVNGVRFGGDAEGACASCGGSLHHLITLTDALAELGVTGLDRLTVATCLSCLGWEVMELHYQHDDRGVARDDRRDVAHIEPQFPVGPLRETSFALTRTRPRWRRQDWGLSNGRENLNRVGGEPCWIQGAQYPGCEGCGRTMRFLLQLDGPLPLRDDPSAEHMWGSGGLGYGFWCDPCRRSALLWQCT